ncbi:MAG: HAD family hydrolase [Thermoplasmata archaeon]
MPLRRPRLITFDAFGTLFRAEDVASEEVMGAIVARNELGMQPGELARLWWDRSYQIAFEDFVTVREATEMALTSILLEMGVVDDAGAHTRRLLEGWAATEPYPETEEVLAALEGFELGIVSNIDVDILESLLRRSRLGPRFAVVMTSEERRAYKPDPSPFQEALRQAGCRPGEAIHLGDSPREDVLGATRAGMMAGWIRRREAGLPEGVPEPAFTARDLREAAELILASKPGT